MREGVEYKNFGDVVIFDKHFNGIDKSIQQRTVTFKHVSAEELKNMQREDGDVTLLSTGLFEGKTTKEIAGQFLSSAEVLSIPTGGAPNIKYFNGDFVDSGNILCVAKDENVCLKFVYYALLAKIDEVSQSFRGASIKHPQMAEIWKVKLPMPCITDQRCVIEELDRITAIIADKRQQLKELDNLAQTIFFEMFGDPVTNEKGWEIKTLGEISTFRRGSFPQPYGNPEWYDGEGCMPFVQVADLQDDSFDLVSFTKNTISKLAQPMSVFVPSGTVLVSLQGSIGKVAISQYDSYVDRTVAIFREIDKRYLCKEVFAFLIKYIFADKRKRARGISIKTITKEEFTAFECPIPPLDLQGKFTKKLLAIREQEKLLTQSIAEFENLLAQRMEYHFA